MAGQELAGRVAVVTGASRGIGAAIAERLASAGATVVVSARSIKASHDGLAGTANEVVSRIESRGGKAVAMACDVENGESRENLIKQVVAKFGRIDILVNNAGRAHTDPIDKIDMKESYGQVDQYVLGPMHLMLESIPHMRKQGEGWIVNLGSASAAFLENIPAIAAGKRGRGLALYGALKSCVHRMTQGFAVELYHDNIGVSVVAPVGMIITPGTAALGLDIPELDAVKEPVEHICEATLALVSAKPLDTTGHIAMSFQYLDKIGRSTMSLDGKSVVKAR
jgi:NAD(P)-dependent dehydrogenase (short-subunit alcohol dehydrogenase family)